MKKKMINKFISVIIFFGVIMISLTVWINFSGRTENPEDINSEQIVAINEITQLIKSGNEEKAVSKLEDLEKDIRNSQAPKGADGLGVFILCTADIVFLLAVFIYIYLAVLRPFEKMKSFAEEIALGNFDIPLEYERSNYFGEFTWAFDSMRKEITKARRCEKSAVESNKTIIATLSHDIKTPVASIRAYAEGLEAGLDSTPERRAKYLSVIIHKCDEVVRLTDDLFLHSISALDKLKINPEKIEICSVVKDTAEEISADKNDVIFHCPDFTAEIFADRKRLMQIMENIINNSRKYAKTNIDIYIRKSSDDIEICFRDYGRGIPNEDMPFIFDKFYRGKNCAEEQGSGLGLYIIKHLTEKMNGKVLLQNCSSGLEVIVSFPVKKEH